MKKKPEKAKRERKLQYAATPEGREIIARIADYSRGPEPMSFAQIAKELNEEGMSARRERPL
jgi:hypothetical protein